MLSLDYTEESNVLYLGDCFRSNSQRHRRLNAWGLLSLEFRETSKVKRLEIAFAGVRRKRDKDIEPEAFAMVVVEGWWWVHKQHPGSLRFPLKT